jgi:hypothetical protein
MSASFYGIGEGYGEGYGGRRRRVVKRAPKRAPLRAPRRARAAGDGGRVRRVVRRTVRRAPRRTLRRGYGDGGRVYHETVKYKDNSTAAKKVNDYQLFISRYAFIHKDEGMGKNLLSKAVAEWKYEVSSGRIPNGVLPQEMYNEALGIWKEKHGRYKKTPKPRKSRAKAKAAGYYYY